jgi:hypothetical protein
MERFVKKGVTLSIKVRNAGAAGVRILGAVARGEPVRVSDEERDRRLAICRACRHWKENGNLGFGECSHPQCGCTRFKHGLATEKCPMKLW